MSDLMTHVLAGFETWERTFVVAGDGQCAFVARGRIGAAKSTWLSASASTPTCGSAEIRVCGRPLSGIAALAARAEECPGTWQPRRIHRPPEDTGIP